MIPQNFKDIVGYAEWASHYQSFALIVFVVFFLGIIFRVMSKPKKFYSKMENVPLDDDITNKSSDKNP